MIEICLGKGRKHRAARRIQWLPAFSYFPSMFSKASFPRIIKAGYYVNPFPSKPSGFYVSAVKVSENTMEKGEIACSKQFLLYPQ